MFGGGLGGRWKEIFQGLRWTHRVVMFKQRLASMKIFGIKFIKLQKPVLGGFAMLIASLGYAEWYNVRHALKISNNEADMLKLFDKLDQDHSGSLDRAELEDALKQAGIEVNFVQLELMMRSADANDDGKISKEEWMQICQKLTTTSSSEELDIERQKEKK